MGGAYPAGTGRTRRPRGSLTPDVTLDAAEEVAAHGFDALTMRAVAARLGAVPMALYNHFATKEQLVDALLDRVLATGSLSLPAMRSFLLLSLLTVAATGLLAAPGAARAETDEEVRDTIRGLALDPPMLYPTRLPDRLVDAEVTLSTDAGISVSWDRGTVSDRDDNRVGSIGLSRGHRSRLRDDKQIARSRGFKPRKERIRGRTVWRLCGHVCGYAWIEQGRYYGVYGIYYVGDENGSTVRRDQKQLIRSMRPLR